MNTDASSGGKRAVHVKWAGKTIALGTFPASEADEKCARAKALTRSWRSTMRPKPTRDWVMLELERVGVRVVSGRLGRKVGDEGDDTVTPENGVLNQAQSSGNGSDPRLPNHNSANGNGSAIAGLIRTVARRNSSLGLSLLADGRRGSLGSLGQMFGGGEPTDIQIPPHRPYKGGGAAAAYEAAFHDHYLRKSEEQQRRASSLGLGSLPGAATGAAGSSTNPDHYEMLKLHHMNLLNEIQETTLMMTVYQQQQLQRQLQLKTSAEGLRNDELALLLQRQQQSQPITPNHSTLQRMLSNAQLIQRQKASLGLGGTQYGLSSLTSQQLHKPEEQLKVCTHPGSQANSPVKSIQASGRLSQSTAVVNGKRTIKKEDDESSKRRKGSGEPATPLKSDDNDDGQADAV